MVSQRCWGGFCEGWESGKDRTAVMLVFILQASGTGCGVLPKSSIRKLLLNLNCHICVSSFWAEHSLEVTQTHTDRPTNTHRDRPTSRHSHRNTQTDRHTLAHTHTHTIREGRNIFAEGSTCTKLIIIPWVTTNKKQFFFSDTINWYEPVKRSRTWNDKSDFSFPKYWFFFFLWGEVNTWCALLMKPTALVWCEWE